MGKAQCDHRKDGGRLESEKEKGRKKQRSERLEDAAGLLVLKLEEEVTSQETQVTSRSSKRQRNTCPLKLPEGNTSVKTLILGLLISSIIR